MTRDDVQRWLDRYVDAWRTYHVASIGDLFAPDATYRYHPYDEEALVGREAIIASWREDQDAPASWSAHYEPYAVDGDRAVAIGHSRYLHDDGSLRTLFFNTFLLDFDADGRCLEFVESFMELPERLRAGR